MDRALHAIAEPRRRRILHLVADRELTAGDIAAQFNVTRPAISQHLRVLREANLVTSRREGTRRYYRARPQGIAEIRTFLDDFWDVHLQQLKLAAEREERETHRGRHRQRSH
jgi:DNA-binding transcriptional ArsR family regulator